MKKTYERKVFRRKLSPVKMAVNVMMRLLVVLLLGFPLRANAQARDSTRVESRQVKGRVTDEKGVSLPGVTVRLAGTTVGTATDVDGKFRLVLPADTATLVVSFIGMKTVSVKLPLLKAREVRKELAIVLRD